jgi:hypothetical protein
MSDRIVSEVSAPMILHRKEIKPLSKIFTTRFEARNIYFEVCMSPPFLDNLPKRRLGSI